MKVILNATVEGIGGPGTIKDVADGYARNYLLPKGLATPATKEAIKRVQEQQAAETRRIARAEEENKSLAERLNGLTLTFNAKVGEKGRLYGSITSSDISEAIKAQVGEDVDKRKIELPEPIHHMGTYSVPVKLVGRLAPVVNVVVEAEEKAPEERPAEEAQPE